MPRSYPPSRTIFPRTVLLLPLALLALPACRGGELVYGEDPGSSAGAPGAAGQSQAGRAGTGGGGLRGGSAGSSGSAGRSGAGGSLPLGGSGGSGGAKGVCGDGIRGAGEACDGKDRGTATCASVTGVASSSGTLGCFANCTLDAQACVVGGGGAGGASSCGDGKRGAGEPCDGKDLGGATCASVTGIPASTGLVSCFGNCTLNASDCRVASGGMGGSGGGGGGGPSGACGDGVRSGQEQCDGASVPDPTCANFLKDPGATGTVVCHANCTLDGGACVLGAGGGTGGPAGCGDKKKGGSEACDGTSFGNADCASALGVPGAMGSLVCFPNCTLDLRGCSTPPSGGGGTGGATQGTCGDDIKSGIEQCDKTAFGLADCKTVLGDTNATGALACFANCTIDAKGCAFGPVGAGGTGAGGAGGTGAGGAAGGGTGTACEPRTCQGKTYECGDCLDNDGDGRIDQQDTECLNPCDNAESGFFLDIPGGDGGQCKADCYFDQDSGGGNDQCSGDRSCDPLSSSPNFYPSSNNKCGFDQGNAAKNAAHVKECATIAASNGPACESFCGPLTPNGCDCFGCCELPAGGGDFIFLGSTANGTPSCKIGDIGDPTKCHPCTPVQNCLNKCETCELCLGKDTLPASCFPPAATCGDGTRAGREQCDLTQLGGQDCASFTAVPAATGTLTCAANCTYDGSGCKLPLPGGPFCGNGIGEGFEQCDGGDVRGADCADVTGVASATGTVLCNPNCTLDGRQCTIPFGFCGDGFRRGFEQCDGADPAGATCASVTGDASSIGTVKCLSNCVFDTSGCSGGGAGGNGSGGNGSGGAPGAFCGDGTRDGAEACDKGDLGGATCASVTGNPASQGLLACFVNCTFDARDCGSTGSGGSPGTGGAGGGTPVPLCPNTVREGVEACDTNDFGGASCKTITGNPDATGVLICAGNCTIDASGCKVPPPPPTCPEQVCLIGRQRCGFDCQPACPTNEFCSTGCCQILK